MHTNKTRNRRGENMYCGKELSKKYKKKIKRKIIGSKNEFFLAVEDVNIIIPRGKIIGLLGINGAGKSTIIKMLATLLKPNKGYLIFNNKVVADKNVKLVRSSINMIAGGERNLFWRLSAYENLRYFGTLYGLPKKKLERRIDEMLSLVGLEESKYVPVEQFSKGMKQRLQIAKGLINDPEYILLDEPTLGLDINISIELKYYIEKLARELNKGILITTHNIKEAEELCDYVYILNSGKVISAGTVKELITSAFGEDKYQVEISASFHEDNFLKQLQQNDVKLINDDKKCIIEINGDKQKLIKILDICFKNNMDVLQVDFISKSLEDVILYNINKKRKVDVHDTHN